MFDEQQYCDWLSAHLTAYASEWGYFCPVCYRKEKICYGHNPRGSQRVQCRACKKVWTPKQQLPIKVTSPEQIETVNLILPFQGSSAEQKLYVLLSFDAVRGNILHLSTNFTQHQIGETLRYRWRGNIEPDLSADDIIQRVDMCEAKFLRRSQFDEIQYGSATLKRNAKGAIIRPVIAAHGHFRILHLLYPEVKNHVISHECFLRGATITAWSELFRQREGELWFIEEEIMDNGIDASWNFSGATYHGWWKNQWQLWIQGRNKKMVCSLTNGNNKDAETISLAASKHFIHWLNAQTAFLHSAQLSAGQLTQVLFSLAQDYNRKYNNQE